MRYKFSSFETLIRYPSSFQKFPVDKTLGFSGRKARIEENMRIWIRCVEAFSRHEELETGKGLGGAYKNIARNPCFRGIVSLR